MPSQRPIWETSEWKNIRDKVKKSNCEWCGNGEILIVQQTWSFPKYIQIRNQVFSELFSELKEKGLESDFQISDIQKQMALKSHCPECDSATLQIRKVKRPKYRCSNNHEFDYPVDKVNYEDPIIRKTYYEWRKLIQEKYSEELETRISLIYKGLEERYLSGKETITLCRSCAYHRKQGNIKCQICNKNFHSKKYESCYECNSVVCQNCGKNRILKVLNRLTCDQCVEPVEVILCGVCNINPAEQGMRICGDCVLQGHWID